MSILYSCACTHACMHTSYRHVYIWSIAYQMFDRFRILHIYCWYYSTLALKVIARSAWVLANLPLQFVTTILPRSSMHSNATLLISADSTIHIEPSTTSTEKTKKKRRFALPWWCTIVAWFLLAASVLVSAAFVTFYGIMFADDKCKKWITSMFISFLTSIFLTQPIKVFICSQ